MVACSAPCQSGRGLCRRKSEPPAPEFEITTLEGKAFRLSDFLQSGQYIQGYYESRVTSPMCAFEVPAFNELNRILTRKGYTFFSLHTRESHPSGSIAPPPQELRPENLLCPRFAASRRREISRHRRSSRRPDASRLRRLAQRAFGHSTKMAGYFSQQHGQRSRAAPVSRGFAGGGKSRWRRNRSRTCSIPNAYCRTWRSRLPIGGSTSAPVQTHSKITGSNGRSIKIAGRSLLPVTQRKMAR